MSLLLVLYNSVKKVIFKHSSLMDSKQNLQPSTASLSENGWQQYQSHPRQSDSVGFQDRGISVYFSSSKCPHGFGSYAQEADVTLPVFLLVTNPSLPGTVTHWEGLPSCSRPGHSRVSRAVMQSLGCSSLSNQTSSYLDFLLLFVSSHMELLPLPAISRAGITEIWWRAYWQGCRWPVPDWIPYLFSPWGAHLHSSYPGFASSSTNKGKNSVWETVQQKPGSLTKGQTYWKGIKKEMQE